MTPVEMILSIAVAVVGLLAGALGWAFSRIHDQRDRQDDHRDRRDERRDSRFQDARIDIAGMQRDVKLLMEERGKCDAIELDVALLKGSVANALLNSEKITEILVDLGKIDEKFKTVFSRLDALPALLLDAIMARQASRPTPKVVSS